MRNWYNKNLKKVLTFHKPALIIVLGGFGGLFTFIFSKLMLIKPDGVYIGQPNSWGDWVVHISITNIFANKPINEWFLYHPFFAQGKLTYGFLVHLITAFFMRLGFSIDTAFFIVSILLLLALLTGLYFLYFQLSNSRKESVLGIFLFLTSSGMGIFRYFKEISLDNLFHPTQDYTRLVQYDWLAGNIPAAMLLPQRAFFIGVVIGTWVLNLLLWGLAKNKKKELLLQKKLFVFAGFLAGILPIAHMHSFIVIMVVTGTICAFNTKRFKQLIYFVIPAGVLSTFLYTTFIHGGIQIDNFMTISVGWTAPKSIFSWTKMWLELWGTFLPLVVLSLITFKRNKQLKKYYPVFIGFSAIFILANSIVFQPTRWDNTKLFAWVYLGLSILVSKLLFITWKKSSSYKILVIILLVTLSLSGVVELMRILDFKNNTHMLSSQSEITLAQEIAKNTATDALFLTGPQHNHPIPLWANRPIFIGYLGWVKNFGFEPSLRDAQTKMVFSGHQQAHKIIIENEISYVFVGQQERSAHSINFEYLQQFPIAFQNENTIVYDTRELWQ